MAMDLNALVDRCQLRFHDPDENVVTVEEWAAYINARYRRVSGSSPLWPWKAVIDASVTIAAETRGVALPDNVFRVVGVHNLTDDVRLRPYEGWTEQDLQYPDDADRGVPTAYRIYGGCLQVYPMPEATTTFRLQYHVAPADLTDSDEPVFPAEYHEILVEGALADAYNDDGQPQQAAVHEDGYKQILSNMRADLLDTQQERYHEIVDDWWS